MEFSPAIGMHAGYLPGYPASHGCVRMPRDLAARFFERVNIRTPVTVTGSTQNLASVSKGHPTFLLRHFVCTSVGRELMDITDHFYVGSEAAMSIDLAGGSSPDGIKGVFIVFCDPLQAR
jgi:L,D-transpeptidase-like protein